MAELGITEGDDEESSGRGTRRRRGRRGGRGRRERGEIDATPGTPSEVHAEDSPEARPPRVEETSRAARLPESGGRLALPTRRLGALPVEPEPMEEVAIEVEPRPRFEDDEHEEVGRPEGPFEELHVDPYGWGSEVETLPPPAARPVEPLEESLEAEEIPAPEEVEADEPPAADRPARRDPTPEPDDRPVRGESPQGGRPAADPPAAEPRFGRRRSRRG